MSRLNAVLLAAVIAIAAFIAGARFSQPGPSSAAAGHGRRIVKYVCPMHPEYVSDRPGDAPCCGMRLEPVYEGDETGSDHLNAKLPPGAVVIRPGQQRMLGLRTAVVERSPHRHAFRTVGKIAADERRIYRLNTSSAGWIRNTFSNTVGSIVKKDEPLATFYTREFLTAQRAYFYALDALDRFTSAKVSEQQLNATRAQVLAATDALEGLGMTATQIEHLRKTRDVTQNIEIRSPATGFVLARNVSPGQRFESGDVLYIVADLSRVWVLADLFTHEADYVHAGQPATVRIPNRDKTYRATVSEVLPDFNANTRTLKVRLEVDNPQYSLRPDMFVDVEFAVDLPQSLTAPVDAVLDSGIRKTVYVDRGNGRFEPRLVETGWRFGDRVQIKHGLNEGDRVVMDGAFLLDSESRMKLALASATSAANGNAPAAEKDPVCGMDADPTKGIKSEYSGKTYYFCSAACKRKFDAEPAKYVRAEQGGIDPICGMTVKAADAAGTSTYKGKTYYFCSPSCKRKFDADPAKYADKGGART